MTEEAELVPTEHGLEPQGPGWFVLNATEAPWTQTNSFGRSCGFEGDVRFEHVGVNIHVIQPGQPNCKYHYENQQEDFLVLSGECLLLVEGQERRLKAWDFVHCPAGTAHVFVGAGDGPCAILMVGARVGQQKVTYPVSELAQRRGAGAPKESSDPREVYAGRRRWTARAEWPPE